MSKIENATPSQLLYCTMSIGEGLLASGAEVSRVEDTICRICKSFGAERVDVFTITSSIVVTIFNEEFGVLTQTRRIKRTQYNLHRLERLNQLSRKICSETSTLSIDEIWNELNEIEEEKGYSFGQMMLLYALISSSFSIFFGGSIRDAISSAIIGFLLKIVQSWLDKIEMNPFIHTFLCSIFGGVMANLLVKCGLGQSFDMISMGNIMLLIPGITMTNGIRDMFSGDMISGLLRFVEAMLSAVIIAFAFILAAPLT